MTKVYVAETPLILLDAAGKEYRVEAGAAVALTPEQYQDVAAHVTLLEPDEPAQPEAQEDPGQSEAEQSEPEQPEADKTAKPPRNSKAKEGK